MFEQWTIMETPKVPTIKFIYELNDANKEAGHFGMIAN